MDYNIIIQTSIVQWKINFQEEIFHYFGGCTSLVPRPIPSISMLHGEKREEGLVREVTCGVS